MHSNKLKDFTDLVCGDGCILCQRPAEAHHPLFTEGMSQRASDWLIIPLCERHHRTGGVGIAIHASQGTFEGIHGSEKDLLAKTIERTYRRLTQ